MERAAAGEPIVVTRRGKPHLRLSAVSPELGLAA
jgi:prevent-host-death family protein